MHPHSEHHREGPNTPLIKAFRLSNAVRYMPAGETKQEIEKLINNSHFKLVLLLQNIGDHRAIADALSAHHGNIHATVLELIPDVLYQNKANAMLKLEQVRALSNDEYAGFRALLSEPSEELRTLVLHARVLGELWERLCEHNHDAVAVLASLQEEEEKSHEA